MPGATCFSGASFDKVSLKSFPAGRAWLEEPCVVRGAIPKELVDGLADELQVWCLFVVLFHALSLHRFQVSLRRMRTFESVPEMDWSVVSTSVGTCFCWSVVVGGCVLLGPHTMSAFAPISSHLGFCTG